MLLVTLYLGANVIKLFTAVIYEFRNKLERFRNKLERLCLASLSSLAECLRVRPGAYPRIEHLKGLPGANALAYYENC